MADSTKLLLFGGAAAAVWYFYLRTPAAVAPGTPAVITPDPNAIVGADTVAGIQAQTIAQAKAPAAGLSVDNWGYILNQVLAPLGKAAPDPMSIFPAAVPGFDRSQLVTSGQYWAVMGPALKSQLGLSGLGLYGFGVVQ
jgi:hypothetical protein